MKWPFGRDKTPSGLIVPGAAPQTRVIEAKGPAKIPQARAAFSALRRSNGAPVKAGMWVMYGDEAFPSKVGILTALDAHDVATVMLCADDGTNLLEVHALASKLRQATYAEIPDARKPVPEVAASLGYF